MLSFDYWPGISKRQVVQVLPYASIQISDVFSHSLVAFLYNFPKFYDRQNKAPFMDYLIILATQYSLLNVSHGP